MKYQVALILFGLVALSTASGYRKLQQLPIKQSYSAPAAPAPEEKQYEAEDEAPAPPPAPVVYKAPVRNVERAPIRIAAYDEEAAPVRSGYGPASRDNEKVVDEQNKSAKYSFASAVDDGIMDGSHVRQESRDGLKVTGSYAYSDGYFKRTVNYEADENGYRVVGETVEPIGDSGPQVDLVNGKADVHTQISGVDTQYSVNADEISLLTKKADEKSDYKKVSLLAPIPGGY